ncbi:MULTISPECIES: Mor transcription activator family protein [unclassified Duganella]|uniref:Mor transcription activator family protein n=1 Tax=unclassified Duganella TaxID=2636909 RepID=UPI00088F9554|nr:MULTISPECIES: Mor transcription activator family protein [unclassified Duganella]SDH41243.1 Mor transcription activator family protein [Duganella sp. OV458]SDK61003.1 Mor transcription activator family protein [Duganella sp. OV510]
MQEQQYDIVTAMIEQARALLGADALPDTMASELEARLRLEWGGQAVYVKKVAIDVEARRQAIRARYDMTNRRELQAEFGISRGQFYKDLRSADDAAGVSSFRRKETRHRVTSGLDT